MRKKIIVICVILASMMLFIALQPKIKVYANSSQTESEQKLNDNVFKQLTDLDFSNLNDILQNMSDDFNIFGNANFKDKVSDIVSGKYFVYFDSIFSGIASLVFNDFINMLPLILTIIAIAILGVMVSNFSSSKNSGGINDIIHFVCYAVIVVLLLNSFKEIISITKTSLDNMQSLMEVSFPILLTLLTSIGAMSSVAIYKPIVAILTGGVSVIFTNILFPLFIISFVFIVVGNISNTIKLKKFNEFFASVFKWIVGFVLTIFSSFLVMQGISVSKFDSVSIKATKFAVKSYVPIIGNFISDGFDFIVLSSVLIKNAIGVGVLFLVFASIIVPVIKIVVFKLALQLLSAIIEPIGNSRISGFVSSCSKVLVYPIVILLGVAFMFLLVVALIMSTANIF